MNTEIINPIVRVLPATDEKHYLTGFTALNVNGDDWHFHDALYGDPKLPMRYVVAGVDLFDTNDFFGANGVYDCAARLREYGLFEKDVIYLAEPVGAVYAANTYRACADMLLDLLRRTEWRFSFSIDDWLALPEEKERFWNFIQPAKSRLKEQQWTTITKWFEREKALP